MIISLPYESSKKDLFNNDDHRPEESQNKKKSTSVRSICLFNHPVMESTFTYRSKIPVIKRGIRTPLLNPDS